MPEPISDQRRAEIRQRAHLLCVCANPKCHRVHDNALDIPELLAELDRLHTWPGLMSLLAEHYPADVQLGPDDDPGPWILALTREIDRLTALLGQATRFTFGPTGPFDHPHAAIDAAADVDEDDESAVHVTARPGLGPNLTAVTRWSVSCAGWVRTHAGRWVPEPNPSERSEKFMRATRWPAAADAIATAKHLLDAGHPELPEWRSGRRYPMREEDLGD